MLLGVIADDFTGASDIANTLAKGISGQGGLTVAQYMGVPGEVAKSSVEAGVISLKSRSAPANEAIAQSLAALAWLRDQGCSQIIFKYCSTFDSTREGNIGPVGEALAEALGVRGVIACPAFPTVGRTVHNGHLFVHDRLLNESGMQNHPLTPMTDPDIRRWLSYQTKNPVGLVSASDVRAGSVAVRAALDAAAGRGEVLVIADAATDEDLITLGAACADVALITGGSGIAIGLPANFIAAGLATGRTVMYQGVDGHEAILAGSCSGATRGQVATHARHFPVLPISVDAVMAGATGSDDLVQFVRDNAGRQPLAYSSSTPEEVQAAQARYGREAVAHKLDSLFAETARLLVDGGVKRLVVAGGETSGAVAQALDLGELQIGPEIDPGVPILLSAKRGISLALKSGNFGRETFFSTALEALKGNVA
ncbi:four-carbon acid sugar kinase family protein [Agrobacterium sp. AGB01]|uniref:3-oxo-tetronate kinase n=1 Tax=Agrobacterium sp. AGB01 TaxID=2769302 RepID=UPI00178705C5|nr:3-oxo-tetronate kinase [Agrobacterium sp. AGB01]MBD9389908.1 four-carbon acid sugar kinase family protein [Agrobacterium sp. AGB01]